jgi:hypothetical protein
VGAPEWQWWKEFEATEPGSGKRSWRAAWSGAAVRWVVLAGFLVLAAFKFGDGAWLFGLVYLACAIGFFVAYGIEAGRRRRSTGP